MAKGLRPSRCYHWDSPAYTRVSKNPSASFITGIPGNKIFHFTMGNPQGKFNSEVSIVAQQKIQVRHNAMEAARVSTNKKLEKNIGVKNYLFKVRVYPHHVMRENTQASGAGADRVQTGMRRAFGKPVGRAARVYNKQKVMSVFLDLTGDEDENLKIVKDALRTASLKLPGDFRMVLEKNE
ncbi:MAG: 50S ribosomal protein L16 [Candidatus Altiarchaeales archaeon HGW-Altiarchaeales-3]|nr:MAG: 50S ribosomal protein L16 [Candidatus Altiarchaeales archaeon HGW-Altiarchaeales-3]